jgi:NAD(P)-dependent dehydrogenase (short-subunit alcohol dehydrogenase family)
MNRALAPCLAIFAAALAFRIPDLADRPMHADEAVLADKFGGLLETGSFRYDQQDYHGPALAWLTLVPARIAGARRYADLTETMLRIVPAVCGVLLVLMPLALWDGLGRWGAVAAAGLTAISPAMVYYSRYYIPEMLLTTLTCGVIVCGYRYARSGKAAWAIAAGACAGLMFITKETAGIAIACMLLALACTIRRKPSVTWPVVAESRKGNIVNIGSVQAGKVLPGRTHYAPTKLGLEALTRNMSAEMTPLGIRVNCVHPGLIDTDMTAWGMKRADILPGILAQISLGRAGEPREIGKVVAFFASDEASYLTGQSIHVDGGWAGK